MLWFWLVVLAYLMNAISTLISKWLLAHDIPHPVVFTFYIGALNLLALLLIPFGFFVPPFFHIVIALVSGAAFAGGIYLMARALHVDQASQVAPMIGGLQPIFVVLFALFFLPETLLLTQYFGIFLLVLGSIFLGLEFKKTRFFTESWKSIISSSVLFGFSYALLKLVYLQQNFVSGFVWTRIGAFLLVMVLALLPGNWQKIKDNFKKPAQKVKGIFVAGQFLGAISFLLVAWAIYLGPVTIINALQGVQYAFLFIVALFLSRRHPHLLDEPLNKKLVIRKSLAIGIIILGLGMVI